MSSSANNWEWIVIAAYGAVLSTYNAWAARKKDRRQVKVTANLGFLSYGNRVSETMLNLTASNPGHRPVTLVSTGFSLPNKQQMVLFTPEGTTQLPCELMEGKHCTHWISAREVADQLRKSGFSGKVKVRGFYRDAVDEKHFSKPFKFDLNSSYNA
ncbi:MAG TPA: hypothetical protein VKL99_07180 [Candidatus Angelobacter sp.]|nr:hypothetical protein [Candidatus Angelobacter sp.]